MTIMTIRKLAAGIVAGALSVGLCLSSASVANATFQYPISGGNYNTGWYFVEWNVQASYSMIKTKSLTTNQYCKAVQDRVYWAEMKTVKNATCTAQANGRGTLTLNDYVEYYTY